VALRRLLWALFAILASIATTGLIVQGARATNAYSYDATAATRLDDHAIDLARTAPALIPDARVESALPLPEARGASTTSRARSVATNNALRGADGRFTTNPTSARSTASPGSSTHGNSLASDRPTTLYQLTDAETGAHLKWGISSNPGGRYTATQMEGKVMTQIQTGTRVDIAAVERQLVERLPGPENLEPWAGAQLGNIRFGP
jgi:hypothetical protein